MSQESREPILEAVDASKSYPAPNGAGELSVLRSVSFALAPGESLAIVGPSGSGKTTLLGLCAGLDRVSSGSIRLAGVLLDQLGEDERARVRGEHTGFVFQNFQLIPTLTALENVMVPAELLGTMNAAPRRSQKALRAEAADRLASVGLAGRHDHYPSQLSGGEQQRVALARAFINRPKLLFADEPTGNLDGETAERVVSLLFELNRNAATALVLVTHNPDLAARTQRVLRLRDGAVVSG